MKVRSLFALLAVAAVISCTPPAESGKTTENPAPTSDFKVALLTPGPVNDAGWNALAYDALEAIKSDTGAEVNNQEAAGNKAKEAMRAYAQKDFKLVFGHGYEYSLAAKEVAPDFPDTVFVSSSGDYTAKNAGAFRFYLEQGMYLAGMLAAKISKTGTIGSVAAINVPSINSTLKAYAAGAKSVNPNIKVLDIVYVGGEDPAAAKAATLGVIAAGADVVIHQANAGAQGVFDACKEKNVHALGTNANQNANSSGAVVASAFINAKPAFLELAKSVKDGKFVGEVVLMGMDKGTIDFAIREDFTVADDVKKLLDDTKEKIARGELTVPKDEF